eukprot:jgi/Botrbrau1/14380/Bobra.0014s0031.1
MQPVGYTHVSFPPYMIPYSHEHNPYWAHPHGQFNGGMVPWHPGPSGTRNEEVSSIFITGLPDDTKQREVLNLVRLLDGYVAYHTKVAPGKTQLLAWARFDTVENAYKAIRKLNGLNFEEDTAAKSAKLRVKIAKNNTRPPAEIGTTIAGNQDVQSYTFNKDIGNSGDYPECNTLFVGNLSQSTDEEEVRKWFKERPGFVQINFPDRNLQRPTYFAFVEFTDVASAKAIHDGFQGLIFKSGKGEGTRLQYSKNEFGKRAPTRDSRQSGRVGYSSFESDMNSMNSQVRPESYSY